MAAVCLIAARNGY